MSEKYRVTVAQVGSKDRKLEGWFNGAKSELAPDVPIRATDTVVDVGCGDWAFIDICSRQVPK